MTLMRLLIKDCIQVIFAAEFDTLKCMVGVRSVDEQSDADEGLDRPF